MPLRDFHWEYSLRARASSSLVADTFANATTPPPTMEEGSNQESGQAKSLPFFRLKRLDHDRSVQIRLPENAPPHQQRSIEHQSSNSSPLPAHHPQQVTPSPPSSPNANSQRSQSNSIFVHSIDNSNGNIDVDAFAALQLMTSNAIALRMAKSELAEGVRHLPIIFPLLWAVLIYNLWDPNLSRNNA